MTSSPKVKVHSNEILVLEKLFERKPDNTWRIRTAEEVSIGMGFDLPMTKRLFECLVSKLTFKTPPRPGSSTLGFAPPKEITIDAWLEHVIKSMLKKSGKQSYRILSAAEIASATDMTIDAVQTCLRRLTVELSKLNIRNFNFGELLLNPHGVTVWIGEPEETVSPSETLPPLPMKRKVAAGKNAQGQTPSVIHNLQTAAPGASEDTGKGRSVIPEELLNAYVTACVARQEEGVSNETKGGEEETPATSAQTNKAPAAKQRTTKLTFGDKGKMAKQSHTRLTVENVGDFFGLTKTEKKVLLNRYDKDGEPRSQGAIATKARCTATYVSSCLKNLQAKLQAKGTYTTESVLRELRLLKAAPKTSQAKDSCNQKQPVTPKPAVSTKDAPASDEMAGEKAEPAVETAGPGANADNDLGACLDLLDFASDGIQQIAEPLNEGAISAEKAATKLLQLRRVLQGFVRMAKTCQNR